MATSPLPSLGPKRGQKYYLTPAFSGAQKRAQMLCHPCLLGGPQTNGNKIRSGYLTRAFSGIPKPGAGGGANPRFRTPTTPPPTNCWPEAPWGGGGSGGGGGLGGRRGGRGGGGVSGTSEQLGMHPRCEPTVCTAPSRNRG